MAVSVSVCVWLPLRFEFCFAAVTGKSKSCYVLSAALSELCGGWKMFFFGTTLCCLVGGVIPPGTHNNTGQQNQPPCAHSCLMKLITSLFCVHFYFSWLLSTFSSEMFVCKLKTFLTCTLIEYVLYLFDTETVQ